MKQLAGNPSSIKSIQRGRALVNSNSLGLAITISKVDWSKCSCALYAANTANYNNGTCYYEATDPTTLTVFGSYNVTSQVAWEVVEYV